MQKLQTCDYGQNEALKLKKGNHLPKASSSDNINFQLTQTSIGDILPQLLQSQDDLDESVIIKETLSPRIDEITRTQTLYSPPPVLEARRTSDYSHGGWQFGQTKSIQTTQRNSIQSFEENRIQPAIVNPNHCLSQEQSSYFEFVQVAPKQKETRENDQRRQNTQFNVIRHGQTRDENLNKNPTQTLMPAFKSLNDLRYLDPTSRNICAEVEQSTLVASPRKQLAKAVTHQHIGAIELADSLAYANLTQAISALQLDHMRLKTELKFFQNETQKIECKKLKAVEKLQQKC